MWDGQEIHELVIGIIYLIRFMKGKKVYYFITPSVAILKPQKNGPLYTNSNMVIGTLAVDSWAVMFGTLRRGLGGLQPCSGPSLLYQM